MSIRKLFAILEEYYRSLLNRQKILDDPILTERINLEEEKQTILKKPINADKKVAEMLKTTQKQTFMDEQLRGAKQESIDLVPPSPVITSTVTTPKKKRKIKKKQVYSHTVFIVAKDCSNSS